MRLSPWLAIASLTGLTACSHDQAMPPPEQRAAAVTAPALPPAPAPPPAFQIPPGCEVNLSGAYHHSESDTFRYDIADDGGEATILAYRQYGSTRVDIPDGGAGLIHLRRTARGFSGEAPSYGTTQSGKVCQVAWPYEVTACTPTSITLLTPHDFGLREDCGIDQPDMAEDVLVRDGVLDAGAAPGVGPIDGGPMGAPTADGGSSRRGDAGS